MTPEEIHTAGTKALKEWVIGFTPYKVPLSPSERYRLEEALKTHDTTTYKLVYHVGVIEKPVAWLAVNPKEIGGKIHFKLTKVDLV